MKKKKACDPNPAPPNCSNVWRGDEATLPDWVCAPAINQDRETGILSSYTEVYSVIHDSWSVPPRVIFLPRATSLAP